METIGEWCVYVGPSFELTASGRVCRFRSIGNSEELVACFADLDYYHLVENYIGYTNAALCDELSTTDDGFSLNIRLVACVCCVRIRF